MLILLISDKIFLKLFPGENIHAHRGLGGLRMSGLFLKFIDMAVLVCVHYSETGGFLEADIKHGNGAIGLGLFMKIYHFGIIHFINVVARKHQNILGIIPFYKMNVLVNGVGRTLIPIGALIALIGRKNVHSAV